jgi:hypothetical protein
VKEAQCSIRRLQRSGVTRREGQAYSVPCTDNRASDIILEWGIGLTIWRVLTIVIEHPHQVQVGRDLRSFTQFPYFCSCHVLSNPDFPKSWSTAREKLVRLTGQQEQELSTDVYGELIRCQYHRECTHYHVLDACYHHPHI